HDATYSIRSHELYQNVHKTDHDAYCLLCMRAEINHRLKQHGIATESTRAIIGPAEVRGDMALRVSLYAEPDGALVASSEKPVMRDLQIEVDDTCDALMTLGVKSLAIAMQFDADGQALEV